MNRLAFLMQQSEVMQHFLDLGGAGTVDAKKGKKGKGKASASGRRGRLGEEVEVSEIFNP